MRMLLRDWLSDRANQIFVLIGLFLVSAALAAPLQRKGDASEYVLATESLRYDHDLIYSDEHDLRRHTMRRPEGLFDTPNGLTTFPGVDGKTRFGLHSFYYPLLAVPFYAALGYRGFYLLNALAVLVTMGAVYAHFARSHARSHALLYASGAVLLSAAWSYVFFMQTEAVYSALIATYLYLWFAERPRSAAMVAGVMVGAQIPLGVLLVPFALDLAMRRRYRDLAASGLLVALGVAPQIAYNVLRLGVLVPMQARGLAGAHYVSAVDLFRTLFDPSMGVLWFYPIAVYCLLNTRYDLRRVLLLVSCLAITLAMNTVQNIYSHQIGVRFGNYLLPVVLFAPERLDASTWKSRAAILFTVFAGSGLALNPIGNSYDMDIRRKTFLPYLLATHFPRYRDNPEVFLTSSLPLEDWVRGRNVFPDRWTLGSAQATLMLRGVRPGPLEIDVGTWGVEERTQKVTLVTLSGARRDLALPSRSETTLRVEIEPADVIRYGRWKETLTYLRIEARGWTPAWNVEGGQDDRRRLGVRLLRFRAPREGVPASE